MMEPLQNNVCLLSWAVACPWACVLHLSLRTLARHARKRHALARGKRVSPVSKGELRLIMGEKEQGGQRGQELVVTSGELRQETVEELVEEPDTALLDFSPPGARDQRTGSASNKKPGAGKGTPRRRSLIGGAAKARRATPLPAALQPAPGEVLFEAPAGAPGGVGTPVVLGSPRSTRERSRGKAIRGTDAERTLLESSPQDGDETVAPADSLEAEFVRV